jgi:hypothetical protein
MNNNEKLKKFLNSKYIYDKSGVKYEFRVRINNNIIIHIFVKNYFTHDSDELFITSTYDYDVEYFLNTFHTDYEERIRKINNL